MLCTLFTGVSHRLLYTLSSLNSLLHQSWDNKLQKFTRVVLLFSGAFLLLCVCSIFRGENDRALPFAPQLFPFQVLNRFLCKAYSAPIHL